MASRLAASDEQEVVVKRGRIYLSVGIIAAIASGIASLLVGQIQVADLRSQMKDVQADQKTVATKADVAAVGARVDRILEMMIEKQEARPPFPKAP